MNPTDKGETHGEAFRQFIPFPLQFSFRDLLRLTPGCMKSVQAVWKNAGFWIFIVLKLSILSGRFPRLTGLKRIIL